MGLMEHLATQITVSPTTAATGFLAWAGAAFGLLTEIMGKPAGRCAGIGGSQRICVRRFKSNGF